MSGVSEWSGGGVGVSDLKRPKVEGELLDHGFVQRGVGVGREHKRDVEQQIVPGILLPVDLDRAADDWFT